MEITVAQQTWEFLLAILLGAALGVCYDIFRIVRIAVVNPPALVIFEDIIYALVCASATLCYLISISDGRLRIFVLIGEVLGFVLYYCTLGVLVLKISKGIIGFIKAVIGWIWRVLCLPVIRLLRWVVRFFIKAAGNPLNNLKNKAKSVNKHLPTPK